MNNHGVLVNYLSHVNLHLLDALRSFHRLLGPRAARGLVRPSWCARVVNFAVGQLEKGVLSEPLKGGIISSMDVVI